ncbi:hypothetical protein Ahy_B10g106070 [Arachis hypogaea]|uniref:Uncharacterized protein n=1 Tax=Arachis hypogaea TaxID=3818 RepID=A0A444X9P5_ARAHY|nr:hypothetical protein Ahy_B10g106070 [Arachis hypogaea]
MLQTFSTPRRVTTAGFTSTSSPTVRFLIHGSGFESMKGRPLSHPHGTGHKRGCAENGKQSMINVCVRPHEHGEKAAVAGAHENYGKEEAGGDGYAEEYVSNGVVVGGQEQSGKIIVVPVWAVELFVISRPSVGGANGFWKRWITRTAFCKEWQTILAC